MLGRLLLPALRGGAAKAGCEPEPAPSGGSASGGAICAASDSVARDEVDRAAVGVHERVERLRNAPGGGVVPARPIDEAWVTDIRDQCGAAGVAFFFKQWGGAQKKRTGRILEGRTWDEMPDPRPAILAALAS